MVMDVVDDDDDAAIEREARAEMINNGIVGVPSNNKT
jgi:hypothetical protein